MAILRIRNATNTAWIYVTGEAEGEVIDHDHTGDAGDGGQLESDQALKATGDTNNHLLAANGSNGVKVVNPGATYYTWFQVVFSVEGDLGVVAHPLRIYAPVALTIDKVYIAVGTAPVGSAVTVDVNKNGTTIFTDQGKRPSIAAAGYTDESDTPDVTALAAGDYLTVDVDAIGSSTAGQNLTVHVRCKQYLQF